MSRRDPGLPCALFHDVGRPLRHALAAAERLGHAGFDAAAVAVGERVHAFRDLDVVRVAREVRSAEQLFSRSGWIADPTSYHREPSALDIAAVDGLDPGPTRGSAGLPVARLEVDSGYVPHPEEPGAARWSSYEENRRFHLRLVSAPEPAHDWVVCIHGAGMGYDAVDFTAFDVGWLARDLGHNVALPVLPLSGPRRRRRSLRLQFPTNDQMDSVHGLAQAVWELRRTVRLLRELDARRITLHGISLGGFVAALGAALVPDIDRVVVGIPASSLHLLFEERLDPGVDRDHLDSLTAGRRIHAPVDPLLLDPLVPFEGRFVYGGLVDRMAPWHRQAVPLWEHWGRPAHRWYPGGHLGATRSPVIRRFVARALGVPPD